MDALEESAADSVEAALARRIAGAVPREAREAEAELSSARAAGKALRPVSPAVSNAWPNPNARCWR
jgi:hypothetical protein